ncbi:MAG TPA: transposase [Ignavibacteriaceae bacterium]|nr:transposase [Ignavibacteriaceae bacterium]
MPQQKVFNKIAQITNLCYIIIMNTHFHRRNLPHLYFNDGIYFITARLVNSIPLEKLELLKKMNRENVNEKDKRLFKKYDALIDSGEFGENYLNIKPCAEIVKNCLHYPDGKDYKLICYCIMPNHFHLVFELLENNKGISKILQSIKRKAARECNKILNRKGKFWQDESFDRWVRDNKELYFVIRYVLLNPVKAGLVENLSEWEYTYCRKGYDVI